MNRTYHADSINFIFGQSHLRGNSPGKISCSDLMTGCIGISHLYSGYHDLDGRADRLSETFKGLFQFLICLFTFGYIADIHDKTFDSWIIQEIFSQPFKITLRTIFTHYAECIGDRRIFCQNSLAEITDSTFFVIRMNKREHNSTD